MQFDKNLYLFFLNIKVYAVQTLYYQVKNIILDYKEINTLPKILMHEFVGIKNDIMLNKRSKN